MTLRYLMAIVAVVAAPAVAAPANSVATGSYRPGEFLALDLKAALLSPKPLGPTAQFEAYPIEARADAKNAIDAAADKPPAQRAVAVAKPARTIATRTPPARTRIARTRSNPLDANAADTRIQTWPCRSGGICGWR